jgi:hypothetical protein
LGIVSNPQTTSFDIARRAKLLYEQRVRQAIESEHNGDIVVIDVDSGDYEVDPDHLTAAQKLRARRPQGTLFAMRIGAPALARIGARTTSRGA